ncbi:MAG: riboflavin synthase [Armatimonadota bacterium]
MFTGLIEEEGKVTRVKPSASGLRLTVQVPHISTDVKIGDSVAVNGVCLTAVSVEPPMLEFDAVRETVERSALSKLKSGDTVNLERAMRVGDRLGGHMVQGHVDGIGIIREIKKSAGDTVFRFEAPPDVMLYIVQKGSITIDGISLTVADVGEDWFTVAIIPHTLENTTLYKKSLGSIVNLETDIIGRYVYKYMTKTAAASDERLMDKLAAGGFLE